MDLALLAILRAKEWILLGLAGGCFLVFACALVYIVKRVRNRPPAGEA